MALIVLASASGSPGVTTTALGLAYAWPRPVLLVDADPTGGSAIFAGHFCGGYDPGTGLIDLAVAQVHGRFEDAFAAALVQLPETHVRLLPGIRSPEQAPSLDRLWPVLAETLRDLDATAQDVIVDAGRLGLAGWPQPLLNRADIALLVTRSSLVSLAGARPWAGTLRSGFAESGGTSRLGLAVIDESGRWPDTPTSRHRVRSFNGRQVAKTLGLPVTVELPYAVEDAEVYSHGAKQGRKFQTSRLVRSYAAAAEAIRLQHASNQNELAGPRWTRPGPSTAVEELMARATVWSARQSTSAMPGAPRNEGE